MFWKKKGSHESYHYACSCRHAGCEGSVTSEKKSDNIHCPICGASMDLIEKRTYYGSSVSHIRKYWFIILIIILMFIVWLGCEEIKSDNSNDSIYTNTVFSPLTEQEYEQLEEIDLGKGDIHAETKIRVANLNRDQNYRIKCMVFYNPDGNTDSRNLKKIKGFEPVYYDIKDLDFNKDGETVVKIPINCNIPDEGGFVEFSSLETY